MKVECASHIISWSLSRIQGYQKILLCVIETQKVGDAYRLRKWETKVEACLSDYKFWLGSENKFQSE